MAEIARLDARQVRAAEARGRLLAAAVKQFSERPYDVVAVADITGADAEAQAVFERDRWHAIEIMAGHLGLDFENPTVRIALRGAIGGADHGVLAWLEHG